MIIKMKGDVDIMVTPLLLESLQRYEDCETEIPTKLKTGLVESLGIDFVLLGVRVSVNCFMSKGSK